jgi:hypothetical protein
MATTGSFNTGSYTDSGVKCYLVFSWTRTSYSIENNTSTINWTLKGNVSPSGYYMMCGGFTVVIDGETVYSKSQDYRVKVYNGTVIASGTKTLSHNADGTRSFNASASAGIWTWAVNKSGSGSWSVDAIPRQATLTAAPNFNDEENPTITYSNLAGNAIDSLQACITLEGDNDDIAYRDISKSGTSYTFNLTEDERNVLRNATLNGSNTRTVKFYLRSIIGETTLYSRSSAKTLTIVNAEPTIAPTAIDKGSTSTFLTGDPEGTIIKGYNSIHWAVNATTKKGASIVSYSVSCGGKSSTAASGVFGNVESGSIVFSATDNRGYTVSQTLSRSLIDYIKLTCDLKAKTELAGETNTKIALDISGNFFNESFGANANVLTIQYRYKTNDGDYGYWITASDPVISEGRYSLSAYIENLNYQNAYTVQARAIDRISYNGVESVEQTIRIIPVFDWSNTDFNFNVPIGFNGVQMTDFVVEQGTSNGWSYRLWNSGLAECWCKKTISTAISTAWGSLFTSGNLTSANLTFPFEFVEVPCVCISLSNNSSGALLMAPGGWGPATTTNTGSVELVRAVSNTTAANFILNYQVNGRWK